MFLQLPPARNESKAPERKRKETYPYGSSKIDESKTTRIPRETSVTRSSTNDFGNMARFTVLDAGGKGLSRRIAVEDSNGVRIHLKVHRFAVVGKGDEIEIDPHHASRMAVVSSEDASDLIRVTPHFEVPATLRIGEREINLRMTEITTQEDLDAYTYLESFHYKTSASVVRGEEEETSTQEPNVGGRKAVLMCYIKNGVRWDAVAYVELHMPLLMVKPRHVALSSPFQHPTRNIHWEKWDQYAIRDYVNCIVRIARVVTSPEFRGLGLARVLISTAKTFAKERWHIRGRRPLFIEISAEMLKYLDFVSSSGLKYVGMTEGNLDRVAKDIVSMQNEYRVGSGIMSLQKKYLTDLRAACKNLNRDFSATLELLKRVTSDPTQLQSLPTDDYYLLKTVVRTSIPYFLGALDDPAQNYLDGLSNPAPEARSNPSDQFVVSPGQLKVRQLSVALRYRLPNTPHVRAVMDCFGLKGEELVTKLLSNVNIDASGGNIIFVSGPSGSGKSILLQALDPNFSSPLVDVQFGPQSDLAYSAGWIQNLPNDIPLIQYFAERWGIERAIAALNQAGLSEAFVYLKPYQLLSRGQRYRARLAELALRPEQVWLIDEFCADLDPLAARIVAGNLRKHVIKYQRIAIVAAANHDHYLDALRPTRVLRLRQGAKPEVFSYREFVNEFHAKSA